MDIVFIEDQRMKLMDSISQRSFDSQAILFYSLYSESTQDLSRSTFIFIIDVNKRKWLQCEIEASNKLISSVSLCRLNIDFLRWKQTENVKGSIVN